MNGGARGSAASQLAFLQDLQRLLDEGQFVASYKFALLMAIAELCLEREPEADGSLKLPLRVSTGVESGPPFGAQF